MRHLLGDIATPLLAVWGAHDEVTPEADLRRIAEDVQHGRPVGLADAAHLPPADDAAGTAAVLREFFEHVRRSEDHGGGSSS